jgi:hypothetical protein
MTQLIRRTHRWTCIAFVAAVLTYMAAMTRGQPPAWLGIFPAGTLITLVATGLYMFMRPYLSPQRTRRQPAE